MPPTRVATESPPIQERRRDLRVSPRDWVSEPDVVGMLTHRCKMRARLCACGFRNSLKDRSQSLTTRPQTTGCVVHRQQTNRNIERASFSPLRCAHLKGLTSRRALIPRVGRGKGKGVNPPTLTASLAAVDDCDNSEEGRNRHVVDPRRNEVSNSIGASVPPSTGTASESVKQVPDPRCQA
jgi:hypothetical protein